MSESALENYIQLFPGIRDFIFAPAETGKSRTWIFGADDAPQFILNFHFESLLTHGWKVIESSSGLTAERSGSAVSVSASRLKDQTRIVYEIRQGAFQ